MRYGDYTAHPCLAVSSRLMAQQVRSIGWQLGMAAYRFATSMKWFVVLLTLGLVVKDLVPGGEKGTMWGRVVGIGAAWAVIGPALFGYLSGVFRHRIGSWRPWLLAGSALTATALYFLSNPEEYLVVVLAYLLLQVSDDMATGPYSAIVPSLVPEQQRGRVSGLMSLVQFMSQLVGAAAAIMVGDVRLLLLGLAVANLVCAGITLFTVREELAPSSKTRYGFFPAWVQPWKSRDFTWTWFTRFLNALGFYVIITYLAFFLIDSVGSYEVFGVDISPAAPGRTAEDRATRAVFVTALLIAVVASIGAILGGRFADRIGRKKVIYFAGATMAIVLPPFAMFPDFTLIVLLAIPFGVAHGAYDSASWALISDVLPDREELAKDMGLWQSSIAAPQIVGGLCVGPLVDFFNRREAGSGYIVIFIVASAAYAISTVLVRKIRGST